MAETIFSTLLVIIFLHIILVAILIMSKIALDFTVEPIKADKTPTFGQKVAYNVWCFLSPLMGLIFRLYGEYELHSELNKMLDEYYS